MLCKRRATEGARLPLKILSCVQIKSVETFKDKVEILLINNYNSN